MAETPPQSVYAYSYREPDIVTILILASFPLILNVANYALDALLYCGLIGQILIGIAWGTPGGQWLATGAELIISQLGYIGLIMLVYEGGLSTSFPVLKANILLSIPVALTGICLPIAASYILIPLVSASPLQAFAAGASLCSTSLGTTFTVLSSSGLMTTRLGIVLTTAAMLDDVVGLIMVQIITNLGGPEPSFDATTIIRPIFVSIAFVIVLPLMAEFLVRPFAALLHDWRARHPQAILSKAVSHEYTAFTIHTLLLIALVTGASYAGTSNLFAAYLAGACISWWDSEVPHSASSTTLVEISLPVSTTTNCKSPSESTPVDAKASLESPSLRSSHATGLAIYSTYYLQPVSRIFITFFFASIGFAIPISQIFRGTVIWHGIVYAILMALTKFLCGLWVLLFSTHPLQYLKRIRRRRRHDQRRSSNADSNESPEGSSSDYQILPASILGLAMISRGEIGYLISSVAQSRGIFGNNPDSDVYLTVTWAITLCTIIGPVGVGLCTRYLRRNRTAQDGNGDWLKVL